MISAPQPRSAPPVSPKPRLCSRLCWLRLGIRRGPEILPFPPSASRATKDSDRSEASGQALGLQVKSGGTPLLGGFPKGAGGEE